MKIRLVGAEFLHADLTDRQTEKTKLKVDTANSRYFHKFTKTPNKIKYCADRKLIEAAHNLLSSYARQRQWIC
jgi:hypothetical protein